MSENNGTKHVIYYRQTTPNVLTIMLRASQPIFDPKAVSILCKTDEELLSWVHFLNTKQEVDIKVPSIADEESTSEDASQELTAGDTGEVSDGEA